MGDLADRMTQGHPEPCFNLWAFADQDTGVIMRISAKAYVLPGSEIEKKALLKHLAGTDFYSVEWSTVPENLEVVTPTGRTIRGAVMPNQLDDVNAVFGDLLDEIAAMPTQLRSVGGQYKQFRLRTPESPRYLMTVVIEQEDGRLVPVTRD